MLLDHERARLSALSQYDVLDTPPEEIFDRLTTMAAHLFDVDITCITLVDKDRFYFKSTFGADITELDRRPGFCDTTIQQEGVYCIEDTAKDPSLRNHPIVSDAPYIKFYAGSPLVTSEGFAIGTLCIMDSHAKSLSDAEKSLLQELSQFVMFQLDHRRFKAETKQREEDARNIQSLESLGLLTGGIAHDFNNLLVGILGNATLAARQVNKNNPTQSVIADIVHAANQARALTDQLLAYAGQRLTRPKPIDLAQLMVDMSPLIRSSISKITVLDVISAPDLPTAIGDNTQIGQVILNLVINASEAYCGKTGTVTVRFSSIDIKKPDDTSATIGNPKPGEYVQLEVIDSGCGMNDKTLKSLFSPFYSTKFSGRGLGMSIVQRIVRGHYGFIQVESSTNQGCRISVFFPADEIDNDSKSHETLSAGKTYFGNGTVLVVDDEELVLNMSTAAIKSFGFDAIGASSGPQALDILHSEPAITALVLDATMPEMDGAATLASVREHWPDIPTIVTSGHHIDEVSCLFEEFEKLTFLSKPWTIQRLSDALEDAISIQ